MEFTQQDTQALYQMWMSQKSKNAIDADGSGETPWYFTTRFLFHSKRDEATDMGFVSQFCQLMHVDAKQFIPSLMAGSEMAPKVVYLKSSMTIDGEIQRAYIEGNQVIVEYAHTVG